MFDAVIFDCDGVLVDTEVLAFEVEYATLAEFGAKPDPQAYARRYMGLDNKAWLAALTEDFPAVAARIDEFAALAKTRYHDLLHTDRLTSIAGAHDAVAAIAAPKAVASSSSAHWLAVKLQRTGLWPHFDPHVYSTDLVPAAKPAPDIFLHAAAQLGAAPARCLVIEDSFNGVRAGLAAGMTVWGFTGGGHCPPQHGEVLREAGALRVLTNWRDVADAFAQRE